MNDIALFGDVHQSRLVGDTYKIRHYKGADIPWIPHDCTGATCRFCRRKKKEFVATALLAKLGEGHE